MKILVLVNGEWDEASGTTDENGEFYNGTLEPDAQADKWKAVCTDPGFEGTPISVNVFYPDQGYRFDLVPDE